MKYITKFYLLLTCIFLFSGSTYAQLRSQHAAGLRFGSATGFNYRYALNDVNAVEGILSVQSNSTSSRFRLVGLYQYHQPINEDFSWYWGYGGSIGSYTTKAFQSQQPDGTVNFHARNSELALSVDGIAGVEYNIPTTPIAVSLDIKPYFDFLQSSSFRIIDTFGFSVRYQF
ncbi:MULTISPECIES: hypothetical protein [Sphingobacterium]|uniref:Outer membrane protein beta-barrel domain-containing protein n=1 Tax=Sphingobacterium populi TaxID=1812824 RepID=A0ABW5U7J5_9SPHI|nr:hypothetical protein [Sphingobacterium sp. CFCC 11742]